MIGVRYTFAARRRGGSFFSLDRKEAKDQVGKKASLPHKAFALQTRQNHGLESFAPLRSLIAIASAKFPMPLQPHKATIVLPAFARSCFADREKKTLR